ncbi:MAG: sigma-54-dependent Fis family transcriptional regulator [Nitrospirae bacterium]|nr:sigma-54-dependent Fis family transcriptional regulator [Nitrospirota bacterium]
MHNVLIVDDEPVQAGILGEILTHEGFDVTTHTQPAQALALAQRQSFDLVICDLKMPGMDGVELLRELRKIHPDLTVIIMTAYGTIETAVNAMRHGAFDYVTKPFSKEELLIAVQRAMKHLELSRENVYLREELGLRLAASTLIGRSEVMRKIYKMMAKIAQDDKATVLIDGETGTGKELVARIIHQMSPRREAPFIAVNCAAIPDSIMESEFFGYEKGAFTGATGAKAGRFELADRGTLFLDEVAELTAEIQGKLLRVLQSKEFERLGGTRTHRVDVRILAATNKPLRDEVRAGRFREDLYYRLNIVPLTLPPLRERKEDIPLLADYFLEKFHTEGKRRMTLSPDAVALLTQYDYPGNVRELENLLERAVILSDGSVITPHELHIHPVTAAPQSAPLLQSASPVPPPPPSPPSHDSLMDVSRQAAEEAEKRAILDALRATDWNRVKAAKLLQIDYKTLRLKIRRLGLSAQDQSPAA